MLILLDALAVFVVLCRTSPPAYAHRNSRNAWNTRQLWRLRNFRRTSLDAFGCPRPRGNRLLPSALHESAAIEISGRPPGGPADDSPQVLRYCRACVSFCVTS